MWVITPDPTDSAYATVGADRSGQTSCMYFKTNCLQQSLHQFSWTDLPRRCHIWGKIGANVTRQLKSLFSSDSLYNPKGQVLPWQQLALSWAGKAYKNMITWVKKTYVCAKYVRKEHTRHSDSSATSKWKTHPSPHPASQMRARDRRWIPHSGHEVTLDPPGDIQEQELWTMSVLWATASYKGFEATTPNAKACKSASSRVNPWGSNCAADD